MKAQYTARNTLYETLDNLISFFTSNHKKLPEIVLNKAQYQVFTEFNPQKDGDYYYRDIKIRCR